MMNQDDLSKIYNQLIHMGHFETAEILLHTAQNYGQEPLIEKEGE